MVVNFPVTRVYLTPNAMRQAGDPPHRERHSVGSSSIHLAPGALLGIYNSSRTRVAPLFGRLQSIDPSGRSWLQPLLDLASTRNVGRPEAGASPLQVARWWPKERRLPAPNSLLEWLVRNAATPAHPSAWGRRAVEAKRRRLVDRDPVTLEEALLSIERGPSGRAWYVLEGPTQPDVYLATDDVIVVIDAKRTEEGPVTSTHWMPVRHQMLRHLDAVWDIKEEKRVYGIFIVEAEAGSSDRKPSAEWQYAVEATVSPGALERSLPHRKPEERAAISDTLLGVTTWQAVCARFEIPTEVLIPEVVDLRAAPRPPRRRSAPVSKGSTEPAD
jgi:hypothetical protein